MGAGDTIQFNRKAGASALKPKVRPCRWEQVQSGRAGWCAGTGRAATGWVSAPPLHSAELPFLLLSNGGHRRTKQKQEMHRDVSLTTAAAGQPVPELGDPVPHQQELPARRTRQGEEHPGSPNHHWHKNRATKNSRSWTHPQNHPLLTPWGTNKSGGRGTPCRVLL